MGRFTATVGGLILAAALLSLAAACGGDDGGQTTPATVTATATPDLSAVEARLREMVLQQGDLPEGYGSGEEAFVTNEDASAGSSDPVGWLAQLNEWGRVLGIDVYFEPETDVAVETGIFQVDSTASIYETAEGASASFTGEAEEARAADWTALFVTLSDVQVEELPSPALTDDALWLRVTGKVEIGEEEQVLANDLILLRQGSLRGGVMIGSVVNPASSQIVDEMIRAQAQRLIEAAD
jgi:hypothetical protein